jgi:DNA mismatch repair protein MutS
MRDELPAMGVTSILFARSEDRAAAEASTAPACFPDLNLDQAIQSVTADWKDYNLAPFFFFSLSSVDAITYRQEVFQDLENETLLEHVRAFAAQMHAMREHFAQIEKLYYQTQKEAWFLDAVEVYCDAVKTLTAALSETPGTSRGFSLLRQYLSDYTASSTFTSLAEETKGLKHDLSSVRYYVLIRDGSFQVSKHGPEIDYSADVEDTFRKFQQGAVKDYKAKFSSWPDMNHIEAKILEFVSALYPELFAHLTDYCVRHRGYLDATIAAFDREVHFYVAYLQHARKLRAAGLQFCYPRIADGGKDVHSADAFDLTLALKLLNEKARVVCNDFHLNGPERIIVVTGPNQGGKTTFARMFGQLHYLASIGCPVPGREAQLLLFDAIFTHFEREERVETLRGKLQDDLMRVHAILDRATPHSIVILNEIFTSTALQDAIFLSRRVMEKLAATDLLAVWVTFIDELASYSEQTVSMASSVAVNDPASRTFKILRRPADGLSHAMSIAEKYNVTYHRLKERLRS